MLTVGSLFSGIGGFDLGLERAGMKIIWQSEIDPYASAVLKKHWPDVPNLGDITKLARRLYDCEEENEDGNVWCPRCDEEFGECACIGTDQLTDEYGAPDVICGGFPCQPFSVAGKRRGTDDERDMWPEFIRVVRELCPQWVVAENVGGAIESTLERCAVDLEAEGYEVAPVVLPALAVGAEHRRDRLFIVANNSRGGMERMRAERNGIARPLDFPLLPVRDSNGQWQVEPDFCRATDGLSGRVDRLRCLGNAIVPQIAEIIGRAIVRAAA